MNNTMFYYKRALGAFIGRGMYCGNLVEQFFKNLGAEIYSMT